MALYMSQFSYTTEACAALTKNPADRSKPVAELMQKLGGRLLNLYYCFGDYDGAIIFEAPDDVSATSGILAAIGPGHVKTIKTTKLLSVEDTLAALRKAGELSYSAPSGS
jgi:uncharacterized protein with GYD domain